MYQTDLIKNSLIEVVGWSQDPEPGKAISQKLTSSESGLTFESQHPLLTLGNLRSVAPNFTDWQHPEYQSGTQYKAGAVVVYQNKLYRAKEDTTGNVPTNTDYWEPTDNFSLWLEAETGNGITKAIQKFINEKIASEVTKGTLSLSHLFTEPRDYTPGEEKDKFVGIEIYPHRAYGVIASVQRIGLCFEDPGTVDVRLFHSSKNTPVETKTIDYTTPGKVQWQALDWKLPFVGDHTGAGGVWMMGYSGTGKKPIEAYRAKQVRTRHMIVRPFEADTLGIELWDLSDNQYTESTYGINLQVAIETDFTNYIIDQRLAFQDIIAKQVAVHMLRIMAFNPETRINTREQNFRRAELLYEIDGDSGSVKKSGLGWEAQLAMQALHVNTQQLDRAVLKKRGQLKYKTT